MFSLLAEQPCSTIARMSYTIPRGDDSNAIEQEFDLLDWKIRAGLLDEVRESCSRILGSKGERSHRISWAHLLVGTADFMQNSYEAALQHFEAAQQAPLPLRPRARAGASKALAMLGHTAEAEAVLRELVMASPESWHTWEALGFWHRHQGDLQEAWSSFRKATALNPQNPSLISSLVALSHTPEHHKELAVALQHHLSLEPLNLGFRGCLVHCFLQMGDLEKACDQAHRIVLFAPFSVVPAELVSTMHELLSTLGRL